MRLSASSLSAFHECPERWRLDHSEETKHLRVTTSRMVYGTVVHEALHVFHRYGDAKKAIDTFDYYWSPTHTAELTKPIDEWVYGDDYSTMRRRGLRAMEIYCDLAKMDTSFTMALEYRFEVPVPGGRHTLVGYIDRLALETRPIKRKKVEVLRAQDHKSGKRKHWPRHNIQGSIYCYVMTLREFWDGFGEYADEMYERFKNAPRRFDWMDFHEVKHVDGGWRGEIDDNRVIRSANAMGDAVEAGIFQLNISGDTCKFCPYAEAICCGTGLPNDEHGDPLSLVGTTDGLLEGARA